jgi:hypothetical protein
MAFSNEQHRKRYAEDAEFRARKLADNRDWRTEHRDELNAQWYEKWSTDAEFRAGRKAKGRARRLKKKYGLTTDDYARMVIEQNGVCKICQRKPQRWLCVDHCHDRQKVRALLCDGCNTGLGQFGDDADRMREAAYYLDCANGIVPRCRCLERFQPRVHASIVLHAEVGRFRLG